MTRQELDVQTKSLCVLAAMMMTPMIQDLANKVAVSAEMTKDEDVQRIAAEILSNIFGGTMYGVVCLYNNITIPTSEPLDGKGDITTRITKAILDHTFTLINDELNSTAPYPSRN